MAAAEVSISGTIDHFIHLNLTVGPIVQKIPNYLFIPFFHSEPIFDDDETSLKCSAK